MSLFDEGRTFIRVAVNEMQPKSVNPHVPYGPDEVADDAVACAEAGAALVHFHSRHADGTQAIEDDQTSAAVYRRAMQLTAARSGIIMEPTNLSLGFDPTTAEDVPHFWLLLSDPPSDAPLEFVNIDGFRFGHTRAGWDERTRRLTPVNRWAPGDHPTYRPPEVIVRVVDAGLTPFFGLFDLADARLLAAFALEGIIRTPVLVQINFFWDLMRGPTPTVAALDAFLAEWRRHDIDSEVCLFVRNAPTRAAYEDLLRAALERKVHLRVGLGDNAALFPGWTNADMVRHAADLVAAHGLQLAGPDDLRGRVGRARRSDAADLATYELPEDPTGSHGGC